MLKLGVEGKVRPGTKILPLVKLLQEPGSATIVSLQLQATSWLPHTIRGSISAIVKKLGFHVISEKGPGGERIYKKPPLLLRSHRNS